MRGNDRIFCEDHVQFRGHSLTGCGVKSHSMHNQVEVVVSFKKFGPLVLFAHCFDNDRFELEYVTELSLTVATIAGDIEPDQCVWIKQDFRQRFKWDVCAKLAVFPGYYA